MSVQKAYLEPEKGAKIECLFNPSQIVESKSNVWSGNPVKGKDAPTLVFGGGGAGSMTLDLNFDTTDDGSPVTKYTDQLKALMKVDTTLPDYDKSSNTGRPQYVTFRWGDIHSFKAIIANLTLTFTYFSKDGVPLRAKAGVTLKQLEPQLVRKRQNPTSGTPAPHRVHQLAPGETLDRLAAHYYGDSTLWRSIADVNGVMDPLALEPGLSLVIPELEVVRRA